ncbi:hypothetical protein IQ259_14520 [Fortiea sp. LEGE XX443]|uniref:hypothetical protein n=1 Tax=Fortiea sp. LEGE XX443 TaxID=1828611 RepID=UPI00187ED548|nr:hypothetical protein [Fortiea sp. LEGE XX443]MBE9006237.1 hypothetical protein [Fortiea sp. LEGE XX443]
MKSACNCLLSFYDWFAAFNEITQPTRSGDRTDSEIPVALRHLLVADATNKIII